MTGTQRPAPHLPSNLAGSHMARRSPGSLEQGTSLTLGEETSVTDQMQSNGRTMVIAALGLALVLLVLLALLVGLGEVAAPDDVLTAGWRRGG